MLNNNVALTVQLTDVANAPKNVNGINKTYNQASDENNYRGWVMNYKPETNLITITGTLVTHSDLVCQINGFSDKYASINADSLSKETRVCFCIKAPKGFYPDKEGMNDFCNAFDEYRKDKHNVVRANFNKQINGFVTINKASSFIYSAATDEVTASLVIFTSFDNMNFFGLKQTFVKRLVGLVRSSVTIKLS